MTGAPADPLGYYRHFRGAPMRKAKRTQWEAADMEALMAQVGTRWYREGFIHHMPERASEIERLKGKAKGVRSGWPDVTLHVPMVIAMGQWDALWGAPCRGPIRAALELKAEHKSPQGNPPAEWWLEWKPDIDPLANEPTRYSLMWSQAKCLQLLHACGYRTMVAYGWREAIEFLDEVSGPKPKVLPEGFR